ncbi:MAG: HD domain-containing protein, partial [Thermoguttaceae bacterium]|nr:HD domain-containing protein [Thermoguttaceae bacterium]
CEKSWRIGKYYKIRGVIRNTNYGSQLDIQRIREVTPDDRSDGFSESKCRPTSEIPPEATAAEILALANQHLGKTPLLRLVQKIYKDKRLALYESPASRSHHRTYVGGLLEHTLSVTKLAILLTDYFHATIPGSRSQLYKPLVVAGAILHDIGKILDTQMFATGPRHTLAGELVGHAILGSEIALRYADEIGLSDSLKTQLIHLILTHSRFQDWGAPTPPSSLEAMILHYADYADSTFVSSLKLLSEDAGDDAFTERKGPFGVPILKPTLSLLNEKQESKTSEQKNDASQ